ncbi:hypothetical protein H2198_010596 [Neophaeococcomyces mojaviensis]|uniref:Uncharacterized protein n=1 Tax=Neophaeococcomyces mojaviensis TaxID=3383035 RepID=A0ACC2ZRJ0_9EURO|nr:hypothetical protein H2198_010596 [Knufia sp. JES_112]
MALSMHRFRLGHSRTSPTAPQRFGLIGYKEPNDDELLHTRLDEQLQPRNFGISTTYISTNLSHRPLSTQPEPSYLQKLFTDRNLRSHATDLLCFTSILTLFGLLLAYYFDGSSSHFNNFFNSQGILPKLVLVGLATLADTQIKHLERVVRITEPYRRLSLRNARPETTILYPLNGTCWSNLPRCLYYLLAYNGENAGVGWQTAVSVVACLSDFNIVAVAGVLFTDAQTTDSLLACIYIAIGITAMMLLIAIAAIVWWRRVEIVRVMPRRPDTIGTVMSYLCGSIMVWDWMKCPSISTGVRWEDMSEKGRSKLIIPSGKRFQFGKWLSRVDEKERWCIDFEEDADTTWLPSPVECCT